MQDILQTKHQFPFTRPDRLSEPLYVVTPIFNAPRFRSRWRLYCDFKKMVEEAGAILYTVEIAFGDRDFVVTESNNPEHLQLRTTHELWLKEAAINLIVQRLPLNWKYMAWVDADCHFARYDWVDETRHLLERYPCIQMWSQLHDLNSKHELVGTTRSFGDVWVEHGALVGGSPNIVYPKKKAAAGVREDPDLGYVYPQPHRHNRHPGRRGGDDDDNLQATVQPAKRQYPGAPGLAWAMRREAWDALGGLIDYSILGAGDWYMAHALTGQSHRVLSKLPQGKKFSDKVYQWEERARDSLWNGRPILGNLGVMKGVVLHYWHGPKANRLYGTREQILVRNNFDPDLDLVKDWQGLYQLSNRTPQLRRDLQGYFDQRNEDAL